MSNSAFIVQRLRESGDLKHRLAKDWADQIAQAGDLIATAFASGRKLLLFGNGGSAADAQHLAAEFVGRFAGERAPLPALALTTDTSALTAIGNDYGFEQIFARQVAAFGQPEDVAIAISTSGNSPDVLAGVEVARQRGLTTLGLMGGSGGRLAGLVDVAIVVPSTIIARIQECHITIGHVWCEMADRQGLGVGGGESVLKHVESSAIGLTLDSSKAVNWETLLALRKQWREAGKQVVWTNGCFDLLHVGHIASLQAARRLGDVLVVGVNSDASVKNCKGADRPLVPAAERAEVLTALSCVDAVIIFDELTPEVALSRLKPEVHCKGEDYAPPQGKPVPEAAVVAAYGGRIEFLPFVSHASTSNLIRRIRGQE